MAWQHHGLLFSLIINLCLHYSENSTTRKHYKGNNDFKVICYYGSWAGYPGRSTMARLQADEIDPYICTHMVYAFAKLSTEFNLECFDEANDLPSGRDGFGKLNSLKKKNPKLKTLLGVGGWNAGSHTFSQMASSHSSRRKFVKSAIEFLRKYNFDGLDLDWEYPTQRDGSSLDRDSFSDLCKSLRDAFNNEMTTNGQAKLILSAAVSAVKSVMDSAYDVAEISQYLDLINLISYDYHGGWETIAEHHSPLYGRSGLSNGKETMNVDWSVQYWLSHGCPPSKLTIGIPLYGRTFTLADPAATDFGSAASGAGAAGPYTGEAGILAYFEICDKLLGSRWKIKVHPEHQVPYATSGNFWLGYDDENSVRIKSQYIKDLGLGGAMLWSIEQDDFKGECSDGKTTFPLVRVINSVLRGQDDTSLKPLKIKDANFYEDDYDEDEDTYIQPVKKTKSKRKQKNLKSLSQVPEATKLNKQVMPEEDDDIIEIEPKQSRAQVWDNEDDKESDLSFHQSTRPFHSITQQTRHSPFDLDRLDEEITIKTKTTQKENPLVNDEDEEEIVTQKTNKKTKPRRKNKDEDDDTYDVKNYAPSRPSNDYSCLKEGVFRDPKNCTIFYRCIRDPMNNLAMSAWAEVCPGGLTFDTGLSICNWPDNHNSCSFKG